MPPTSEFLGAILDSAPDPVIATDVAGTVTFANEAASKLLGQPIDTLVGRPILKSIACGQTRSRILGQLRDRELTDLDIEIESSDGSCWTSVSSRRLRLPSGAVVGNVVFLRDVTERHRAEDALAAKNAELESYVSHVSHDLRSPLSTVLGFTRLLRDDYEPLFDRNGLRFLDRIEQAGRTMTALIEDLLELSRIGRVDEPAGLVDPLGVIQQVVADHKPLLDEREVEIVLPEQPPMLACNRTRLYQVFSNLIGNALAHMGPVDHPRIEISIDEGSDQHHIRVADNGRGVPPEHRDRIFQVFSTAGRRADGRKSTGVGLAIVGKIAAFYGGRVWLESPEAGGAAFHVTLRTR